MLLKTKTNYREAKRTKALVYVHKSIESAIDSPFSRKERVSLRKKTFSLGNINVKEKRGRVQQVSMTKSKEFDCRMYFMNFP